MAACIPTEKIFFHDWFVGRIRELQKENPGNDAKVMAGIHDLLSGLEGAGDERPNQPSPNRWEQVAKSAGGASEGVLKLLREMEPLYQRLAVIMALPQPDYEARAT